MRKEVKRIMQKLLEADLYSSACNFNFIQQPKKKVSYDDVCEAIMVLNQLSLNKDDSSKNTFITIAALLWEHTGDEYYGLRDILIILLSRIGYAPSSIILDSSYREDCRFQSLSSIISEWETAINHRRMEISVNEEVFLLTDFQYDICKAFKEQKLIGVSAPTSAGKSFVLLLESARLVIEKSYDVIYIVPTLSLVNQVTEDYIKLFKRLKWTNYEILNSYNEELRSDTIPQIFVLTQERAIGAFSITEEPFEYTSILIIDEIQNIERVIDDASEMRSKILLDTIFEFRFLNSIDKIVISGPRINAIDILGEKLFGISEKKSISTDISPVLNITYGISKRGDQYFYNQYCSSNEKTNSIPITNTSFIAGHGQKRYNEKFLEYLVSFVSCLGDDVQNIVFSPTSRQARETALAISQNQSKKEELKSLSQYLKDTVHNKYSLAETVKSGVAYHHGKLPTNARKVIEKAMADKLLHNIACTTTLMQGMNMPAQNIIIRNPHLYIQKTKCSAELSSYEMANLRGRAGRLLKDFIGRTYVLDENEFLLYSDEYIQETLFDNTYKELDSSYKKAFEDYSYEIKEALSDNLTSDSLSESYRHIVIHIRQTILRHGNDAKRRLESIGISLSDYEFNEIKATLSNLAVPSQICVRNRYWDPLVLDILFQDRSLPSVPGSIKENNIQKKLFKVLEFLRDNEKYERFFKERLPNRYQDDKMLSILCSYAEKWAQEKTLKNILNSHYHDNPDNIEETISLLQKTISFDLPILLRPIYEVQGSDAVFLTFLESGAYQPITRKLIEIGIPRETSIYLYNNILSEMDAADEDLYETIRKELRIKSKIIPYWIYVQISFLL